MRIDTPPTKFVRSSPNLAQILAQASKRLSRLFGFLNRLSGTAKAVKLAAKLGRISANL